MGKTQKQIREDIRADISKQFRDKIAEQEQLIAKLKGMLEESYSENERLKKELRVADYNRERREDLLMKAISLTSATLMLNKKTKEGDALI